MSRSEAITKIEALLDAMETCHVCQGALALDDVEPTHCENCSSCCDEHDAPECTQMFQLHREARLAVRVLSKGAR